MAIVAEQI